MGKLTEESEKVLKLLKINSKQRYVCTTIEKLTKDYSGVKGHKDYKLYGHYTDLISASKIINGLKKEGDTAEFGGFRLSREGQGGGGLYFTDQFPHEAVPAFPRTQAIEVEDFTEGVLKVNYGNDRAKDPVLQKKTEVFFLLAIHADVQKFIEKPDPKSRKHAWYITKDDLLLRCPGVSESSSKEVFLNNFKSPPHMKRKRVVIEGAFLTREVSNDDVMTARDNQVFLEGEPYTAAKNPRELRDAIIAEVSSRGEFLSTTSHTPLLVGLIGGTSFFNPESESLCQWLGYKLGNEKDILFVTGGFANQAKEVRQKSTRGGSGRGAAFVLAKTFREVRHREKRFGGVFHCLPKHDKDLRFISVSSQDEDGFFHVVKDPETGKPFGFTCFLGESVKEREAFMTQIVDVMILIEGGPGAAHEASQACKMRAPVIPIRATGGAAGGNLDLTVQNDKDKDNLFKLPLLLQTPQGAEDWLTVNGPFSNDYEKEHIADAVVRIIRTLAATNSEKEASRSFIYDYLQKNCNREAPIVGIVIAPDCPGIHYQFNHLVCQSIGKKLAKSLKGSDEYNSDVKRNTLALLSLDNNTVTDSFQSSCRAILGKEGIVFTLKAADGDDENNINHLSTTIPSADGYENRLKILCSLSEVVIFIGGVEIEAIALNRCPEAKRILVACTGGAAAGYYGVRTQQHQSIDYRIRSICASNPSGTADAVVNLVITKLTKPAGIHDTSLMQRSLSLRGTLPEDLAESQPRTLISIKYLADADMLKQQEQPEDQFNIIVNSVSPEWQSTRMESGINKAIALVAGEELNDSLNRKTNQFNNFNHGDPTYGDVIKTPAFQLRKQGFQYVIHAVGPDCSKREKRHEVDVFTRIPESELCSAETKATMFVTYFRILALAHLIGLENLRRPVNLCTVQIGTGAFKVPKEIGCEMFALALRTFTEAMHAKKRRIFVESVTVCLGDAYEKMKHYEAEMCQLRAIQTTEPHANNDEIFVKGLDVECNWQRGDIWYKGEIVEINEKNSKGNKTYKIRFHDEKWFQFKSETAKEEKSLFDAAIEDCKCVPLELLTGRVKGVLFQRQNMILARIPAPHTKTHKELHPDREDKELQKKLHPPFNYKQWAEVNWTKKGSAFLVELLRPTFLHFELNEALHELSVGTVKVSLKRNLDPLKYLLSNDSKQANAEASERFDAVVNPLPPELSMLNAPRRGIHYFNRRLVEHENKVHQEGKEKNGKTTSSFEATLKLLKEKFVTHTNGVAPTYGDVLCSPGLYFPPEIPDKVKIMHVIVPVVRCKEDADDQGARDPVEAFEKSEREIEIDKHARTVLGATYFALYFRLFVKFANECASKSQGVPCLCTLELCDTLKPHHVSYEAKYFALAVRVFSDIYPHHSIHIIHSVGHLCQISEAINRTEVYLTQLRVVQSMSEEALHQILLTCLFNDQGRCFLSYVPVVQSKFNRQHESLGYYNSLNQNKAQDQDVLTKASLKSLKLQLADAKFLHEKPKIGYHEEFVKEFVTSGINPFCCNG